MSNPTGDLPSASEMELQARQDGERWLKSTDAQEMLAEIRKDPKAVKAVENYFADRDLSVHDVMYYFIVGYLGVGTSSGYRLRTDHASSILLSDITQHRGECGTIPAAARDMKDNCPAAFQWMLRLLLKHSTICQCVVSKTFGTQELSLQRRVVDPDPEKYYPIESWTYGTPASVHGDYTLSARVPVEFVLSLRGQEHELVLRRDKRWMSSIKSYPPEPRKTRYVRTFRSVVRRIQSGWN